MIKSKQVIGAVFCFAFLFAKSSFANFPSFDPLSYIPDLKQYKELVADLRNTKEQLNQIRQDLRSMGDSVRSVASYSQTVMRTVQKGAAAVSKAADVINKTLGTDIKVGEEDISKKLFKRGICLPSDTKMTEGEQRYVIEVIKKAINNAK
jgi:dTDP-4-amino-4,6-dideoxygalactose transaminase